MIMKNGERIPRGGCKEREGRMEAGGGEKKRKERRGRVEEGVERSKNGKGGEGLLAGMILDNSRWQRTKPYNNTSTELCQVCATLEIAGKEVWREKSNEV